MAFDPIGIASALQVMENQRRYADEQAKQKYLQWLQEEQLRQQQEQQEWMRRTQSLPRDLVAGLLGFQQAPPSPATIPTPKLQLNLNEPGSLFGGITAPSIQPMESLQIPEQPPEPSIQPGISDVISKLPEDVPVGWVSTIKELATPSKPEPEVPIGKDLEDYFNLPRGTKVPASTAKMLGDLYVASGRGYQAYTAGGYSAIRTQLLAKENEEVVLGEKLPNIPEPFKNWRISGKAFNDNIDTWVDLASGLRISGREMAKLLKDAGVQVTVPETLYDRSGTGEEWNQVLQGALTGAKVGTEFTQQALNTSQALVNAAREKGLELENKTAQLLLDAGIPLTKANLENEQIRSNIAKINNQAKLYGEQATTEQLLRDPTINKLVAETDEITKRTAATYKEVDTSYFKDDIPNIEAILGPKATLDKIGKLYEIAGKKLEFEQKKNELLTATEELDTAPFEDIIPGIGKILGPKATKAKIEWMANLAGKKLEFEQKLLDIATKKEEVAEKYQKYDTSLFEDILPGVSKALGPTATMGKILDYATLKGKHAEVLQKLSEIEASKAMRLDELMPGLPIPEPLASITVSRSAFEKNPEFYYGLVTGGTFTAKDARAAGIKIPSTWPDNKLISIDNINEWSQAILTSEQIETEGLKQEDLREAIKLAKATYEDNVKIVKQRLQNLINEGKQINAELKRLESLTPLEKQAKQEEIKNLQARRSQIYNEIAQGNQYIKESNARIKQIEQNTKLLAQRVIQMQQSGQLPQGMSQKDLVNAVLSLYKADASAAAQGIPTRILDPIEWLNTKGSQLMEQIKALPGATSGAGGGGAATTPKTGGDPVEQFINDSLKDPAVGSYENLLRMLDALPPEGKKQLETDTGKTINELKSIIKAKMTIKKVSSVLFPGKGGVAYG